MARAATAGGSRGSGRGREADQPRDIPRRGWMDILKRTWSQIGRNHLAMIAAGIAFYALLALFPAIAATISIWGLLADPQQIEQQIDQASTMLPGEAASIITEQARSIAGSTGQGIGLAAIGGILLALYSSSKGAKALIEGLNIAYGEEEQRGFIRLNLIALGLTLAAIVAAILTLGAIAVLPALLGGIGLGSTVATLLALLRWPILFAFAMGMLAVFYRYAPSRDEPRWQWVSWGAGAATLLWLLGSIGFSLYVANFNTYNETYGTLGAVIILLLWLFLSAFVVLLGAQLNAEMEHQTGQDTTRGSPQPRGRRGALVADTLGERR